MPFGICFLLLFEVLFDKIPVNNARLNKNKTKIDSELHDLEEIEFQIVGLGNVP